MKQNIGCIDRFFRIATGLGLILWGVATKNLWGLIGIIPLFTAVIGLCPVYLPFGFSSCKKAKEE